MPSQQRTFESRIDYSLLLPVFLLLSIGVTAIYIAVSHDYPNNVLQIVGQQVVWILLGFLISFIVMFFNTKFLWKMTPFLYLLGLGLMVLPLVFYSESLVASTGAKNWVSIRGVTLFQPSEFMKISYILMLSRVVVKFLQQNRNYERTIALDLFLIVKLALYTLPVLLLLALQSDLGTALVFSAIYCGIVLLSGVSWKIILPVFLTVSLLFTVFMVIFISNGGRAFLHGLGMPTYQINRISAWLHAFEYAQTVT